MLALSLFACAFAVLLAAGAFGLVLRRLSDLGAEVRHLRTALSEARAPRTREVAPALALAGDEPASRWLEPSAPWPARDEQPALPYFDKLLPDPPARTRPPSAAPAATPEALRAVGAALSLSLPALALVFGAPPLWVGAAAYVLIAAAFALSLQTGWAALAWVGAFGGGAWAVWAAQPELAPWSAAGLAGAALVALSHAALTQNSGPGGALTAFTAFAAFALAANDGGAPLAALGAILAAAAIIGGGVSRLESIHVGAFLGVCGALLLLGGGNQAWFAPAAAWAGALFAAIAAVRAPTLRAQGVVVNATGVSAPILAAMSLHAAQHGLGEPWAAAAALLVTAGVLAAILAASVRAAGGLAPLGLAAAPLMIGAPAALALAASLALSTPLAATAFAATAALVMRIDQRWPHLLWRAVALTLGLAAIAAAAATTGLMAAGLEGVPALLAMGAGLGAPAACFLFAAYCAGARADFTRSVFEAAAIATAFVGITALVRWAGGGAAEPPGFAEAGLHAATWGALALLLGMVSDTGARSVRAGASIAIGALALVLMAVGPFALLNPAWGVLADAALGQPLFNTLLIGFLLPAVVAATHARFWRANAHPRRAWIGFAAAVIFAFGWAVLEIRRAFHGADLTRDGVGWWELGAYGALLALAVGAALVGLRPRSPRAQALKA